MVKRLATLWLLLHDCFLSISFSFLDHFLLPWSDVYQSMKHAVSFVRNVMMLTRINMFSGGDIWPNSF